MDNYTQYVKEKLWETIQSLESLKSIYVQHADKDFTRNRELSFETTIKLILEMEGGTLGHELRHYFSFSLNTPNSICICSTQKLDFVGCFSVSVSLIQFCCSLRKTV